MVTSSVLHGYKSTAESIEEKEDEGGPLQDPVAKAEISIEGQLAVALIDTSSPIVIVSIQLTFCCWF